MGGIWDIVRSVFGWIGRFFYLLWRIITYPFRLLFGLRTMRWQASLPIIAGLLMFVFLIICVIVVNYLYAANPLRVPWAHSSTWTRSLTIFFLTFFIPFILYFTLRMWLEGDVSPYEDIDRAWKVGLDELKKFGLDIRQTPVFLVLGAKSEDQAKALFAASQLNLRLNPAPEGESALHWFANADGIFLTPTRASCLSALARRDDEVASERFGGRAESAPSFLGGEPEPEPEPPPMSYQQPPMPAGPPMSSPPMSAPPPPADRRQNIKGTMMLPAGGLASLAAMQNAPPPGPPASGMGMAPPPAGASQGARGGTLVFSAVDLSAGSGMSGGMGAPPPSSNLPGLGALAPTRPASRSTIPELAGLSMPELTRKPVALTAQLAAEQTRRLEYLCHLLTQSRRSLCPVNGILCLLPFSVMRLGAREGNEIQKAAKSDIAAVVRTTLIRCPASVLVVGLEQESGFRELVRRVGQERASVQRFGKGFSLWATPVVAQLEALSMHACQAFESWSYALFRERGALHKPGNTKLFALLCEVRRSLQGRLAAILTGAFGYDPKQPGPPDMLPLFSGCYFAATGDTPDRQAFVKGVFDKLIDEQEEVTWTTAIQDKERFNLRLGYLLLFLNLIVVIGLIYYAGQFFTR